MTAVHIVSLLYHSVYRMPGSDDSYAIDVDSFADHLRGIREEGIECMTAGDLGAGGRPPDGNGDIAILTFDDGRMDNHEIVFPVLEERSLRATFFVNPARVGTAGYMDWGQLAELDRHGMSIQSHGLTHCYLHRLADSELDRELGDSKAEIESRIGKRVEFLSVPGGFYSGAMIRAAWRHGYRGVFTSDPGVDRFDGDADRALLHRYNIRRGTTGEEVRKLARRDWKSGLERRALHGIKAAAKTVLGASLYRRTWTKFGKRTR